MHTPFGLLLPLIPIEILLSTKGLMFLLLSAYGGAMWTFLSGAPRVHTLIVPDLAQAQKFYEGVLQLSEAELPLQYYYGGYEAGSAFDPAYFPGEFAPSHRPYSTATAPAPDTSGLWYQLSDNVQLHIIVGNTQPLDSSSQYETASYRGGGAWSGSASASGYKGSSGSSTMPTRSRHISFDRDAIKALLKYVVKRRIPHSVRTEKPLCFWIRDPQGQIIEMAEVSA